MSARHKSTPQKSSARTLRQDEPRGRPAPVAMVAGCVLAAVAAALLVAACAASSSRESTAEALTGILAGDQRPQEERARDVYRHPKETLLFFGIRPEMTV